MQLKAIEADILKLCNDCLSIKDAMFQKAEISFSCYVGGGRQYHSEETNPYRRTIYLGRDSARYNNVPEDIIDLNEVYFLYKRDKGLFDWPDNYFHDPFKLSVEALAKKEKFLIIDYENIKKDSYYGLLYEQFIKQINDISNLTIRFVKII